ncbi:MAG: ATP-binding cassette domain-containing protein [Deltaproteobacteria bacterium]|nr:ATP-binding cassette domain-containing protein [Deltaproteobacteria bacterium]
MRIEMENVVKDFGKVRALNGIDLQIPSGRRIGLIGPNGSGKSTLAKILIGLLSCEGKVRLDGLAPQADRKKLAARISYIPQVAPHFAAPVREVIRLVVSLRDLCPSSASSRAAGAWNWTSTPSPNDRSDTCPAA